jgi:hypothetical protein
MNTTNILGNSYNSSTSISVGAEAENKQRKMTFKKENIPCYSI